LQPHSVDESVILLLLLTQMAVCCSVILHRILVRKIEQRLFFNDLTFNEAE